MRPPDPAFEEHRPALERLAYRMLGSLADADDVMQEAYLRWGKADRSGAESPPAFSISIVTRLCTAERRTLDAGKERYVARWRPDPVVEVAADPARRLEA